MRIASWNINSVRLRIDQVLRLLEEEKPDVLCLQEIKCTNDQFPRKAIARAGYEHMAVHGQKGYHGVATIARMPFRELGPLQFCGKDDCRHMAVEAEGVEIHNFYVPAGGDVPDPEQNEKFAHKLGFLDEMTAMLRKMKKKPAVLVGDLNIAPFENDVWSHKQLLAVVSHTPVETEGMARMVKAGGMIDVARRLVPMEEKLYSWWSYRAKDWAVSDRGRRLDHIWTTGPVEAAALSGGRDAFRILKHARGWERPSDHAPVMLDLH